MPAKTWFITDTSRGFGREWAIAALDRGDQVAATARDTGTLRDLVDRYGDAILPLRLDVTDRAAGFAAVRAAHDRFGRLDVVVNNAGYGHFGLIEEITEAEARAQFEANFFGALWITQAALPCLRAQGGGHILQVSSIGGVSAFPNVGIYNASKWALEGLSQALAAEVAAFGVRVTIIEPGAYATDWAGASGRRSAPLSDYAAVREEAARQRAARASAPGDPAATRSAILQVADADDPPLRMFLGRVPLGIATSDYESRLATWRDWQPVSEQAQGGAPPAG
jgi:NAD(P)-dependent dehydrogenase (short-subunit alcohol dehydrogenase family)